MSEEFLKELPELCRDALKQQYVPHWAGVEPSQDWYDGRADEILSLIKSNLPED